MRIQLAANGSQIERESIRVAPNQIGLTEICSENLDLLHFKPGSRAGPRYSAIKSYEPDMISYTAQPSS